jgi:AP-1 complex subunit beta-1
VQLQILNSAVKTFLKTQTEESYGILNQVFEFTSKEADNPDLRDRGFIYWRLLAIDPNLASLLVLSEKPRISEDVSAFDSTLLDILINNLGTLSTIYVKPPELFVKKTKKINIGEEEETDYEENAINVNDLDNENTKSKKKPKRQEGDQSDHYNGESNTYQDTSANSNPVVSVSGSGSGINLLDINDILGGGNSSNTNVNTYNKNNISKPNTQSMDMMNLFESNSAIGNILDNFSSISINTKKPSVIPKQLVLNDMTPGFTYKRNGLSIEAAFLRDINGSLSLSLTLFNKTNDFIKDFEIQFNRNYFGLNVNSSVLKSLLLQPGSSETKSIEVIITNPDSTKVPSYDPPCIIQTAIRCSLDEFYFTIPVMFCTLFKAQSQIMSFEEYQRLWMNIQSPKDIYLTLNSVNQKYQDIEAV